MIRVQELPGSNGRSAISQEPGSVKIQTVPSSIFVFIRTTALFGKPSFTVKGSKGAVAIAHSTASQGAGPEAALPVFQQCEEGESVGSEGGRIWPIKHSKTESIEAHQPVQRRHPQIAVASLEQCLDRILRKPVFRGPGKEAIRRLRRRGGNQKQ